MGISNNTGATATANTAASVAITIPSGVLTGDVMLMSLNIFTEHSTAPSISFSGAGGSWTLVSPTDASANPQVAQNGTIYSYGYAYWRAATSGDPGQALTITETGSPSGTTWLAVAIESYTGASTGGPIDVAGGATGGTTDLVQCPGETTGVAGDWAIYMAGGGANGTGTPMVGPTGATQRQTICSNVGIAAAVYDSNGSVGGAGTSIGGTSAYQFLTSNHPSTGFLTGFTIGLAPAGGTPHTATAALTVTPTTAATAAHGHYRTAALALAPSVAVARAQGHVRTVTLALAPSFQVTPSGGVPRVRGGVPDSSESREFKRWLLWEDI